MILLLLVIQMTMVMLIVHYLPIKHVILISPLIQYVVIYEMKMIKLYKYLMLIMLIFHYNHHHIKIHLKMINRNLPYRIKILNVFINLVFQIIVINNNNKCHLQHHLNYLIHIENQVEIFTK